MARKIPSPRRPIATLNEGPLHAGLKAWYAQPGDREEVPIDGRQIDLVRGDLLIEIQTSGFTALKKKLRTLLKSHPVRLVYPVAFEKWIVRLEGDKGRVLGRRKSPKRGRIEEVFAELIRLPHLISQPNFSLEILLTQEDEHRRHEPGRVWRRKGWVIVERRLIDVVERRLIQDADDLRGFLPKGLPALFTTAELSARLQIPRDLAQKMAYCLFKCGAVQREGRNGNAHLYRVASSTA